MTARVSSPGPAPASATPDSELDALQAVCCVVGGGPAGVVLSLLLARQGIPVTLLEEHADFDRDFRGDTIHTSTMELMDQLGLADRLLELPHTRLDQIALQGPQGTLFQVDLGELDTRFPFTTIMPQARFLEFLVEEARRYPAFRLVTGASVRELIVEGGVVRGVRYRTRDGQGTVRAPLTVGADGRFSRLRHLIGFEPIKSSVPMDVLWFRIPRRPGDPEGVSGRVGNGHIVAMLDRGDQWQVAYVISKGTYRQVRDAGISELRRSFAGVAPDLADRLDGLTDWKQMSLLSVEASRLARWYTPGLLLIGDAAHVMSPVAGVGINYAIQDAVAAANILSGPLKSGRLRLRDLAAVQREREWPTRIIQAIQSTIQQRVIAGALDPTRPVRPPLALRLPLVRRLFARVIAYGVLPTRLKQ